MKWILSLNDSLFFEFSQLGRLTVVRSHTLTSPSLHLAPSKVPLKHHHGQKLFFLKKESQRASKMTVNGNPYKNIPQKLHL